MTDLPVADQSVNAEYDCEDMRDLLPLIADGVLTAEDDPAAFAHLAQCDQCAQDLAQHDMITLALQAERHQPAQAAIIRLPWPARIGGFALAAAALLSVGWLLSGTIQGDTPAPSSAHVIQILDGPAGRSYLVRQPDGRIETVRSLDQPSQNRSRLIAADQQRRWPAGDDPASLA